MHTAAKYNIVNCLVPLLQYCKNPNVLINGKTPLDLAVQEDNKKCIDLLISHGATRGTPK